MLNNELPDLCKLSPTNEGPYIGFFKLLGESLYSLRSCSFGKKRELVKIFLYLPIILKAMNKPYKNCRFCWFVMLEQGLLCSHSHQVIHQRGHLLLGKNLFVTRHGAFSIHYDILGFLLAKGGSG